MYHLVEGLYTTKRVNFFWYTLSSTLPQTIRILMMLSNIKYSGWIDGRRVWFVHSTHSTYPSRFFDSGKIQELPPRLKTFSGSLHRSENYIVKYFLVPDV